MNTYRKSLILGGFAIFILMVAVSHPEIYDPIVTPVAAFLVGLVALAAAWMSGNIAADQ